MNYDNLLMFQSHPRSLKQVFRTGGKINPINHKDRGAKCPPPNFAISSQMTMKLGKDILWVETFTN